MRCMAEHISFYVSEGWTEGPLRELMAPGCRSYDLQSLWPEGWVHFPKCCTQHRGAACSVRRVQSITVMQINKCPLSILTSLYTLILYELYLNPWYLLLKKNNIDFGKYKLIIWNQLVQCISTKLKSANFFLFLLNIAIKSEIEKGAASHPRIQQVSSRPILE